MIFRRFLICGLAGVLAGTSTALFLFLLKICTDFRQQNEIVIWFLPVAGLLIGWCYWRWAGSASRGTALVLDEIHHPRDRIPLRMAPFVMIGTLLTHLFGGSAGREGTAVQMGGALAEQLGRFFKISHEDRRVVVMAGMAAGFGAAIGAPLAGGVFGVEVIGRLTGKWRALVYCLFASFVANGVAVIMRAPHTQYPNVMIPALSLKAFSVAAIMGILFGLLAWAFVTLTAFVEHTHVRWIKRVWLRPFVGGLVLLWLYKTFQLTAYEGLSLPLLQGALEFPPALKVPVWKTLLTAITVGSGFKGGEFIPLVMMGTSLGSYVGQWMAIGYPYVAALGFAAVFAGASNTPLACAIMAAEIFGSALLPFSWVACTVSVLVSGSRGIYSAKRLEQSKFQVILEPYKAIVKGLRRGF